MFRTWSWLFALALLAVTGCGAGQPSSPPITDAADSKSGATQPAPATSAAPATATAQPVTPSPAPAASPLRELAARYLDSDGKGGWRTNEAVAAKLEQLSASDSERLWSLLKDPQVEVRRGAAVFLLSVFQPADSNQVAAFTALLDDPDRMVRARALDAVKQFSHEEQIAILPRLTAMLDPQGEDRGENRVAIARLCGALRRDAADSLSALESAAAGDPDPKARSASLAAAAQIATAEESIKFLAKGLADNDAGVRLVAAARLRQLGPAAAPAASELAGALADSDASVAEAAAEALIRVGSAAVEPLVRQLSSGSAPARKLALACLAKLGPVAKAAIPAVEKCKADPDLQVRQLAEAALMRLAGK